MKFVMGLLLIFYVFLPFKQNCFCRSFRDLVLTHLPQNNSCIFNAAKGYTKFKDAYLIIKPQCSDFPCGSCYRSSAWRTICQTPVLRYITLLTKTFGVSSGWCYINYLAYAVSRCFFTYLLFHLFSLSLWIFFVLWLMAVFNLLCRLSV